MANVDADKAQKILMYLWANGFKYTNMAQSAGVGLGADTIAFLEGQGHTLTSKARMYLLCDGNTKYSPRGVGIAGSTYSELVGSQWHDSKAAYMAKIGETFGLNRDEVDTLYSNQVLKLGVPVPARKGGAGRSQKYGKFNRDGWGAININSIAETGSVDSNWTKSVKDNAAGLTTMEVLRPNSGYELGSALGTYSKTLPTVSPSGIAPAASTKTVTGTGSATPAEEEEEEEEEIVVVATPAPPSEFEKYLVMDDLSLWWKDGQAPPSLPTHHHGNREVSSKAWTAKGGKIDIGTAPIRVRVGTASPKWTTDFLTMLISNGDIDGAELTEFESALTNTETLVNVDKDEYESIKTPEVSFVFMDGKSYIEIEGFGMVPATKGGDFATYALLEIVMTEPTLGGEITDIIVNKTSFKEVISNMEGIYGFPYLGFEGLENRFKADNYTDEGAGNTASQQATRALSLAYINEGYRQIDFEPVITDIEFDKATLDETLLQPLALDFDTKLNLDTEGVFFALDYASSKDASNLFPGFNINDSSDSNQQEFMFPFDIRNLKPINEDGKVLSPKKRDVGEGIVSIEVASKNASAEPYSIKLGNKTYETTTYSQIKITTVDGETILIPDNDERFKALDNQQKEIKGTVNIVEGRPTLMVVKGKLEVADIEKYLTTSRRSSRLSAKYNAIDELTGQVDTKTIMVQQNNDYVIIVGIGPNTYAIKIRGD